MAFLYKNKNGYQVSNHSYSGGEDFRYCRKKYELARIQGWKLKEQKASLEFGNSIESAIKYHHMVACKPNSGPEEFTRLWDKFEHANLTYSEKEGTWEDMRVMGVEMLQIYEIWAKKYLGIRPPKFQLNYKKEVFPNTELAGINFTAYIDMVAPIDYSVDIIDVVLDIKTSATPLPNKRNLLVLDSQLRSYAWVTGIQDVGFLWFIKARPDSYKSGDIVTLLHDTTLFRAGEQAVVLTKTEDTAVIVYPDVFRKFEEDKPNHTAAKLKAKWAAEGEGVHLDSISRQRLEFKTIHMPQSAVEEQGHVIAQEIADIHHATANNLYYREPGIRFPNNKCLLCPMLGICTDNEQMIEEKLINPNPENEQLVQPDWLEELAS